jgi:hypothetical protein
LWRNVQGEAKVLIRLLYRKVKYGLIVVSLPETLTGKNGSYHFWLLNENDGGD